MSAVVRLDVTHTTIARYSARVEVAYHCAHLTPRNDDRQHVDAFRLAIDPLPSQSMSLRDSFGNLRTEFALYVPHEVLAVTARSRVALTPRAEPLDAAASAPWESVAAGLRYAVAASFQPAAEFVFASPCVPLLPALRDYAAESFTPGRQCLAGAIELMERIHRDFTYEQGSTDVNTPLEEVFRDRRGVCQDYAHLMLSMLRGLGLPARYISGYLLTHPPAGQARLLGADASHAWVSVWCPPLGWIDLDPTNAVLPDLGHVTLAIGRDYGDVTPLRGVIQGGASHALEVSVDVTPVIARAA
ncbi:MAG TPA: transglutaminase family protein [Burkholderiaceae bacterium]|nr:transglutaminase family protein [Burkholderiaceae bacterium]